MPLPVHRASAAPPPAALTHPSTLLAALTLPTAHPFNPDARHAGGARGAGGGGADAEADRLAQIRLQAAGERRLGLCSQHALAGICCRTHAQTQPMRDASLPALLFPLSAALPTLAAAHCLTPTTRQAAELKAEVVKWREEAGLAEQRARQQEQRHDLVGGQEQEKLGELRDEVWGSCLRLPAPLSLPSPSHPASFSLLSPSHPASFAPRLRSSTAQHSCLL